MSMNGIQIFNNDEFGEVRILKEDGNFYFVASDVAKKLGYVNSSKAVNDHCKGVTKRYTLTKGGNQELNFIPESDVYRLIVHSKLPAAERFEKWVFDEVLPSIRKTGSYNKPMSELEILQHSINQLVEQERKLKAIEAQQGEQIKRLDIIDSRLEVLNGVHIEGTGRDRLNAMVRAYVVKKGISYAEGWKDFKKAYNRAFHTCLGALLTNYTKKNNLRSKPTIPRFLEKTNRLDDGLRVAEKMLNLLSGLQGEP